MGRRGDEVTAVTMIAFDIIHPSTSGSGNVLGHMTEDTDRQGIVTTTTIVITMTRPVVTIKGHARGNTTHQNPMTNTNVSDQKKGVIGQGQESEVIGQGHVSEAIGRSREIVVIDRGHGNGITDPGSTVIGQDR